MKTWKVNGMQIILLATQFNFIRDGVFLFGISGVDCHGLGDRDGFLTVLKNNIREMKPKKE